MYARLMVIEVSRISGWKCECTRSHIHRAFRWLPPRHRLQALGGITAGGTTDRSTRARPVQFMLPVPFPRADIAADATFPRSLLALRHGGLPFLRGDIVLIGLAVFTVDRRGVATLTMTNSPRASRSNLEILGEEAWNRGDPARLGNPATYLSPIFIPLAFYPPLQVSK